MKNILRIDSSLFQENGVSSQLADELISELGKRASDFNVVTRSLSHDRVPHIDADWINAHSTAEDQRDEGQRNKVAYSRELINEVQNADALVIGAPMYNFSVPSVLKAWFDHITQAGVTFTYTSEGPHGLLTGKTAYVITTRGGQHKDKPTDTQIPFIKTILNFIGINDVHVIYAEGLNMGDGARDQGLADARQSINQLLAA